MEELILNEKKLREDLAELINNCKIPAFIIKPIIADLYNQICALEEKQYNDAISNKKEKKGEK